MLLGVESTKSSVNDSPAFAHRPFPLLFPAMLPDIRVFVNSGLVDVPAGSAVRDAVRRFDPALGNRVIAGTAYVTDGRGIEVDPDQVLASGAILRVVVRARRGSNADA